MKLSEWLEQIAKDVAALEERAVINKHCRCCELTANMEAHFGPEGKTQRGLFDRNLDLTGEIFRVIAHYIQQSNVRPDAPGQGGLT